MITLISKIKALLNRSEKKQALIVLFLTILTALLEVIGIASILPFMAVLSSPGTIETNEYLSWGYETLGFGSTNEYLFFLGTVVLFVLLLSNGVKAYTSWKTVRFTSTTGHTLSTRLFERYLHQHYHFFLKKNSSNLAKNILNEVGVFVNNILVPLCDIIAKLCVIMAITILLMIADPILALCTGLILGGSFIAIYASLRKWLYQIGVERSHSQTRRYKIAQETFSNIKNIKLTGHENTYKTLYEIPSAKFAYNTAKANIAGEMPRYLLEVIAFGGILFILLYLLLQKQGLSQALPLMTLYAFAAYRLMPAFQSAFKSYSRIRFHSSILDDISKEFVDTSFAKEKMLQNSDTQTLPFHEKIEFQNVSFTYEGAEKTTLNDFNVSISKNKTIGIVGKTGSGKTTFVDLLLGLLKPDNGSILIDGNPLNDDNRRAWQKNCSYVTQHIYLADDTIRANIGFGLKADEIDDQQVKKAARMAAIDDFIENELTKGYDTIVGENGIRLSGGQRQRIGLARALYLDRPILVLDEATSALDMATEKQVMEQINKLDSVKTIVIIAHRLESLERAEQIISMGK